MQVEVKVPDIGDYKDVEVIEVLIKPGDVVAVDASLVTLETDKATMEIPATVGGTVAAVAVKVGDRVSMGSVICALATPEGAAASATHVSSVAPAAAAAPSTPVKAEAANVPPPAAPVPPVAATTMAVAAPAAATNTAGGIVYASPSVRRLARELGVDLTQVRGSGEKSRIIKQDVVQFVKQALAGGHSGSGATASAGAVNGLSVAALPTIDHAKFGAITIEPLSRIKKISGAALHRNWVVVPHVTQFDEADITELEEFRKNQKDLADKQGIKLTPLVFLMKAVVAALKAFPTFNASLDNSGQNLILKQYFHIGVAVDTPNGLVVPIVRDVDQKGLFELAKELAVISAKAREGKLTGADMQGSSFSISSLGGIGGSAFTPIVNVPDVAILGVSKAAIKPIYSEGEFKPRLMLPLSLSYEHRVIEGADGARFTSFLVQQLSDIRRLLL
jgi:pyruvate dehydrogenase E2 component (dihydrolipoamide acetyltransferase)